MNTELFLSVFIAIIAAMYSIRIIDWTIAKLFGSTNIGIGAERIPNDFGSAKTQS